MKNYLELMNRILEEGDLKGIARKNMPRTKELFGEMLIFDLQKGFPLLTTKKMFTRGVIEELLWFLRGVSKIGSLVKKGINIWNQDCYNFFQKFETGESFSYDEWLQEIRSGSFVGDMGESYPKLWRNWDRGNIDQIKELINGILQNPNNRYQLVTAWDPYVVKNNRSALPSCHVLWQTNVRKGEFLDLNIYQRSCDYFLGVPFNISSYSFLIHILSKILGYKPGRLKWIGGSVHLYENQINAVKTQLTREPGDLPKLEIKLSERQENLICQNSNLKTWSSEDLTEFFEELSVDQFHITNYSPQSEIKAPLSTGQTLEPYDLIWDIEEK